MASLNHVIRLAGVDIGITFVTPPFFQLVPSELNVKLENCVHPHVFVDVRAHVCVFVRG